MNSFFSKRLILRTLLIDPLILCLQFCIALPFCIPDKIPLFVVLEVFAASVTILAERLINRKAFVRVSVSEEGISTKYLFWKWEDVPEVKLVNVYTGSIRRITGCVICFGESTSKSFHKLDIRKNICIDYSEKNACMIRQLSQNRIVI